MGPTLTAWLIVGLCAAASLTTVSGAERLPVLVWLALGAAGVAVALWRARTLEGASARPWQWFAFGGVSSLVNNTSELLLAPSSPVAQASQVGRLFGLLTAGCFVVGAALLLNVRRHGYVADVILMAVIVAIGPVVVLWELVAEPAVIAGLPMSVLTVELAHLGLNVTLLVTVVAVLAGNRRSVTVWLIAGSGISAVLYNLFTLLHLAAMASEVDEVVASNASELASTLFGGLAVVAALHPSARVLSEPGSADLPLVKRRHVAALFVALLALPVGVLFGSSSTADHTVYPIIGFVATVAVAWRAGGLMTDRNGLVERFEAMTLSLRTQASIDALTGLPNRSAIAANLDAVLAERRADLRLGAVMFIDLDDFKLINDSLGHEAGDELLRGVANRLVGCVPEAAHIGRFGGDEFVVVVPVVKDEEEARSIAAHLLDALNLVTVIRGHEVQIKPSLGLALGGLVGDSVESMLRDADTAMYAAKRSVSPVVFDDSLRDLVLDTLGLEQDLRHAIDADTIQTVYQPKLRVGDGSTVGVEVLARWRKSDGQMVPPDRFIPIAEQSGLIHALGRRITEKACQQVAEWREAGRDVALSVNVSAAELTRPDYAATLAAILSRFGIAPNMITLELTERDLGDVAVVSESIARLRRDGVRIAIDDFGTGFFSLSHLRHLPVDEVKIDRSFVSGVATDGRDRAVVRAVIELAAGLDLDVVAEGVETMEQADVLQELGCPVAQGYLWFPPLSVQAATTELVRSPRTVFT